MPGSSTAAEPDWTHTATSECTVISHVVHGMLPSAVTMGLVGLAALTANAALFGIPVALPLG
jgi:hypothetical protein